MAFTLGAIVGADRPGRGTRSRAGMGVPRRLVSILEGESLVNDATALVAYKIAVKAVASAARFSPARRGLGVPLEGGGRDRARPRRRGVIAEVRKRLDDPLLENTIGLLSPLRRLRPRRGAARVRRARRRHRRHLRRLAGAADRRPRHAPEGFGMWELLQFLLNAFLFILIGLQLPLILDGLRGSRSATLLGYGLAVSAAVVAHPPGLGAHRRVRRPRARPPRRPAARGAPAGSSALVDGWTGMRGAVSLAAALALPADFPQRDLILLPDLRRHLRHARLPGPDAAAA